MDITKQLLEELKASAPGATPIELETSDTLEGVDQAEHGRITKATLLWLQHYVAQATEILGKATGDLDTITPWLSSAVAAWAYAGDDGEYVVAAVDEGAKQLRLIVHYATHKEIRETKYH